MHICKICSEQFEAGKRLSDHIKKEHKLNSEEYTVKCFYGGVKPTCKVCSADTRYVSFSYKEYCKEHAKLAMIAGGKIGGAAEAWNKGKTAEEDSRILQLFGEKNHFFGKTHTDETKKQISDTKRLDLDEVKSRIDKRSDEFELISDIQNYISRNDLLDFKCKVCNTEMKKTLHMIEYGSLCTNCFPNNKSKWELEMLNWISGFIETESGNRKILEGKEIDIYIPSKNFGIECHGLYWHSEASGKNNDNDKVKIELAKKSGVSLFIFYQDEWENHRSIVESMILHRIGLSKKLSARNLKCVQIDKESAKTFFNEHHLDGSVSCTSVFALVNGENEIQAAMSFRKPFNEKRDGYIEIARFATRSGMTIRGGMSKLVAAAQKSFLGQYRGIFTYSDNKIGNGSSYSAAGFLNAGETGLSYFYTDGKIKISRFSLKTKGGITEHQKAESMNLTKVWGPGSKRWIKEFDCL